MLGAREPKHYGSLSLSAIEENMAKLAAQHDVNLACFQANSEEKLIDKIHQSFQKVDFILINPAAIRIPVLHCVMRCLLCQFLLLKSILSNVHKREPFRHHSYFSDVAEGVICGLGAKGYEFALQFALDFLNKKHKISQNLQIFAEIYRKVRDFAVILPTQKQVSK